MKLGGVNKNSREYIFYRTGFNRAGLIRLED
jgi:hypothetical protein